MHDGLDADGRRRVEDAVERHVAVQARVGAGRAQPGGGERVAQALRVAGQVERLDPREAGGGEPLQRPGEVGGDRVADRVELHREREHRRIMP